MKLEGHAKEIAEELAKLPSDVRDSVIEHVLGDRHEAKDAVMKRAPWMPVLAAIQQPLFDSIIIREDGTFFGEDYDEAFVDHKNWRDGSKKTAADSNLCQSGQLGYPVEFTLRSLGLRIVEYAHHDDVRAVLRELAVTWFFGANTPWLRLVADAWKPVMALNLEAASLLNEDTKRTAYKDAILKQLSLFARDGIWTAYQHNIAPVKPGSCGSAHPSHITPDGGRHISGVESFRARFEFGHRPKLHGRMKLVLLMEDTLYAQL
jgi:hypothetical protein